MKKRGGPIHMGPRWGPRQLHGQIALGTQAEPRWEFTMGIFHDDLSWYLTIINGDEWGLMDTNEN